MSEYLRASSGLAKGGGLRWPRNKLNNERKKINMIMKKRKLIY